MSKKIILPSIIAIVLLLIIISVFYFIPSQQIINDASFTCPGGKVCEATPILSCNVQSDQGKVIARTNAEGFSQSQLSQVGVWIALDTTNTGYLSGFTRSNTQSSCLMNTPAVKYPITALEYIYIYNNKLYICENYQKAKLFVPTTVAVTNPYPTEPYASNGQEFYSGNLYSCEREIFIDDRLEDTLIYAADTSGEKRGQTYSIAGDSVISSQGTGSIRWDVEINDVPIITCEVDGNILYQGDKICTDSNTLVTCVSPPQTSTEYRDPLKTNARCVGNKFIESYNVELQLTSPSTITLGEKFILDFDLDDQIYSENAVEVTALLNEIEDVFSSLTNQNGQLTIELEPKNTGSKEIVVYMQHQETPYVSEPINVYVTEPLQITTFRTQSPQFDNEFIEIVIEVSKSGSPKDWKPTATYPLEEAYYNGQKVNYQERSKISTGLYSYFYDLTGDGLLRFRIRAQDETGLLTDFTEWQEVEVKKTGILFKDVNVPFSVCNQQTHAGTFELVDSTGNAVNDANIIAELYLPDQGNAVILPVQFQGDGQYSFSYNFQQAGAYFLDLRANKNNVIGSQLNIPINILSCQGGGGGDDETDYLIYIVIGVLIIGLGGFVYFVFIKK